jgi:hypothetical protein
VAAGDAGTVERAGVVEGELKHESTSKAKEAASANKTKDGLVLVR